MRVFVAIDLPQTIKEQLSRLTCGLPGARWVPPEQLHLTLQFIGEVDGRLFQDIGERLASVSARSFSFRLAGVGFFPPRGKPRVVWVGLQHKEQLVQLRNQVVSRLLAAGVELERRKFSPHITLARLNNTPAAKVGRFLEHHNLFCSTLFSVHRFHLYSSQLGKKGAVHRIEATYELA